MKDQQWLPPLILAAVVGIPAATCGYAAKGCVSDENKKDYDRAAQAGMIIPYALQTYDYKGDTAVGFRDGKGPQCVYKKSGKNKIAECYNGDQMVRIHGSGSEIFQRGYNHNSGKKHWTRVRQKRR